MKQDFPSPDAVQIANNITNLGQMYNREDISTDTLVRKKIINCSKTNLLLGSEINVISHARQGAKLLGKME